MTFCSDSHAQPEWKFSQVFGERAPGEDVHNVDIISAIGFDKSGDYLAVGDRGGRVVIFERKDGKLKRSHKELELMDFTPAWHPEFQYKTEFHSHKPEFDYLKSLEIEEKINKLRWCATPNGSQFILSTNDKTIKLWKVKEHKVKKVREMHPYPYVNSENALLAERSFITEKVTSSAVNGNHPEWTDKMALSMTLSQGIHSEIADIEETAQTRCRKVYAHAHDFNINSISTNSDGETFISADDLRINLWNLEISDQCFNIIDMKPSNMEDLTEVITSAEFHPNHCNLLAYSSSRGFIRLVDMRQSALCDHSAVILQDGDSQELKSFFTEIIASISDIKFSKDGRYMLSRDYMSLKLWDVNMDSSPVATYKVHEHLRPKLSGTYYAMLDIIFTSGYEVPGYRFCNGKAYPESLAALMLCELYDNDCLFDKFACGLSGDGLQFATGSYSNHLCIFSRGIQSEEGITIEASRNPERKPLPQAASRTRRSSLSNLTRFYRQGHQNSSSGRNDLSCNLNSKLLHLAWHPSRNLIACGAGNSLFMYYA